MERLREKDFRACLEFLRQVYAVQTPDDFAAVVLAGLPKLVHSTLTGYNEYNPARNRNRYLADPLSAEPPPGVAVFNAFIHEHPIIRYYRETTDGQALKISDFLAQNQYHRLGLYNEYFRHAYPPVEDLMAFFFLWRERQALAMALCRPKRNFTERDRLLLNLLHPHLRQAYLNAEALEARGLMDCALTEFNEGVIVLGGNLRVRWASSSVSEWLRAYFGSPIQAWDRLPAELLRWVKQELALLDGNDAILATHTPLVVERPDRRLLVRLIRQAVGCLVLLREQSTSLDPDLLKPLRLTPREREVLAWAAQGKSDAAIAIILGMSARTVEKHMEHICAKLAVENRTAAASRAVDFLSIVRP